MTKAIQITTAALLAKAVDDIYSGAKLVRCRMTNIGFYCEFLFQKPVDQGILHQAQERMRALVVEGIPIKTHTMMRENAVELLLHHGEGQQAKILNASSEQLVDVVQIGDFYAVCQGPFLANTEEVKAFILTELSEETPYFEGVGKKMVTRIQGAAFLKNQELKQFQKNIEKAKKQNHIKLGEKKSIFMFHQNVNPTVCCWWTEGDSALQILQEKVNLNLSQGQFQTVITPTLIHESLVMKSTKNLNLLPPVTIEGEKYFLRPSMALAHLALYKNSYTLPVKLAEWGKVYQQIPSDDLYGVVNSREMHIDTQTIFCEEKQAIPEIISSLQSIQEMITMFDIPHKWALCSQKRRGKNQDQWDRVVCWLKEALDTVHCEYVIDEEQKTCWGPRIEARFDDCLEREWSGSFIEINLTLPQQLGLKAQNDDKSATPVVIHRSLLGPHDRFIALNVEKGKKSS